MSVVGIDLGNLQSVVAVARNRGIDVICNEVSNRGTPSLVSFGAKRRYLGEAAKTQEISNFKDTVANLNRLAGRSFRDKEIQDIERQYINAELVDENGQVGVKMNYLGEPRVFTGTQLVAMYLTKLREIASAEIKIPVTDVVISVPGWFTDVQRRSILDAAEIAGLNTLRLMNDTTASALGYGITKTDLPEDKNSPRNVVFVDIGHSNYSVAVVSFVKGQLTVRTTAYDRQFGGRNFDQVLVNHLAAAFKEKYKIDVKTNPRALFRLRSACEKLKRVLSANAKAPLNVESLMNDVDVSQVVSRQEFEELSVHLLSRVEEPLIKALKDANLTREEIHSIELIGGTTRIPAIKERISKFFEKELNFTLNQDEAIARGCALQCAILSPVFKVRPFSVTDVSNYPIKMCWQRIPEIPNEESELLVFPPRSAIPSTKILTFHRKEPFDIEAYYNEQTEELPGINPWIGRYSVKDVTPSTDNDLSIVKVKVKFNVHGVLSVDNANIVEEVIREEKEEQKVETTVAPKPSEPKQEQKPEQTSEQNSVPNADNAQPVEPKPDDPQPMDTDKPAESETSPSPPVKKVKKLVKKCDVPIVAATGGLDKSVVAQLREQEFKMIAADKLVADTEHARNELEEYVYEMRNKLDMDYAEFVKPEDKESYKKLLQDTEDWLYDEGEDTTKSVYNNKIEELKKLGTPIVERFRDSEQRPHAEKQLRESVQTFMLSATGTEEKYAHISDEDKKRVVDKATQTLQWLDDKVKAQAALPKHETPVVSGKEILKERDALAQFANPILSQPKPKPEPPKTPEPTSNTPSGDKASEAPTQESGTSTQEGSSTSDHSGQEDGSKSGKDEQSKPEGSTKAEMEVD